MSRIKSKNKLSSYSSTPSISGLQRELRWAIQLALPHILKDISEWVEAEIILPNGPFAGERYRHHRHPASEPWFKALDSGLWSRAAATGPTQNGKTLMCYVSPVIYHLFEVGETVIIGLPNMDMANDKWQEDFKPVIEASRYSKYLPTRGEGSKGGSIQRAIVFGNGATLRFMTAGGSDKSRAAYTSRVVAITETDGMDEASATSREADKIEQIEARTRAYGRTGKKVYLECTTSIPTGRIWREIKEGTDSGLYRPCPHCNEWIKLEREDLQGWQQAQSAEEAVKLSYWKCPCCSRPINEEQRRAGWKHVRLVHRGQRILHTGELVGETPNTQTLGYRWSAVDNPFTTTGDLGAEEWAAKHSSDPENAEKKQCQFGWALPYMSPDIDLTPLDPTNVAARKEAGLRRGVLPSGTVGVSVGIDTGKRRLHWVVMAVLTDGSKRVVEYGSQPVESDKLGVLKGLVAALRALREYFSKGWKTQSGSLILPSAVWIDSGYFEHTDAVYAFCFESNRDSIPGKEVYRPIKGYGEGQPRIGSYVAPSHKTPDVLFIGNEYYISRVRRNGKRLVGVMLVHINADNWKSVLHQQLAMPEGEAGAIILYDDPDTFHHSEYSTSIVAEKQIEKFVEGKGTRVVWERISRENHYLDASYIAVVGCDFILQLLGLGGEGAKVSTRPSPDQRPGLQDLGRG